MTEYSATDSAKNTNQNGDTKQPVSNIAIIGGGLTGLFTATLLERACAQQQGRASLPHITLFEKSRSVGRLATRYRTDNATHKNWQWAFGAQFFTAKTDSFKQFIAPWLETGLLQPWCAEVIDLFPANDYEKPPAIKQKESWDSIHARYISTPKMTSWGRTLEAELQHTTVRFKTHVAPLSQSSMLSKQYPNQTPKQNNANKTELLDDSGASLGEFDWVICTAPNGQAIELMAHSGFTKQAPMKKQQMQACYTLMLGWDSMTQLPETLKNKTMPAWDVAYVANSPLDRIFIEHHKPAHGDLLPSITIHARNDWSQTHVDEDMEMVQAQLLQAAQQAFNWDSDTAPSQIDCHRWRYAATVNSVVSQEDDNKALGILVDGTHQWIVSGDWCGQGNIESCYQTATETVKVIMATLH